MEEGSGQPAVSPLLSQNSAADNSRWWARHKGLQVGSHLSFTGQQQADNGISLFTEQQYQGEAKLFDEIGIEVDEDVFEEVLKQTNLGVFLLKFEKYSNELAQTPAVSHEGSSSVTANYESDDVAILGDGTPSRKQQRAEDEARILCSYQWRDRNLSDFIKKIFICVLKINKSLIGLERHEGDTSPPKRIREMYAQGIVALFPYLHDPYTKKWICNGQGYLTWKIKNIQRNIAPSENRRSLPQSFSGGPTAEREASSSTEVILTEEQCREAVSLMKHSSEVETVKVKMRETFQYRRKMIQDPSRSTDVLTDFPRFLDIKGLIEQDFVLIFGEKTSAKFLERWPTTFMQKVILQSKGLHFSQDLQDLIDSAESAVDKDETDDAGTNIHDHLDTIEESTQPYLLAMGTKKNNIHAYYIILDKKAIPCKSALYHSVKPMALKQQLENISIASEKAEGLDPGDEGEGG
ncbi:unnamed protein product [Leuciscus chuanchicus]